MKLSDMLTSRKLHQADVARTLGVSRAAVSLWVRTHEAIPPQYLARAQAAMGLTAAERKAFEAAWHDYREANPRKPRRRVAS